MSKLTTVALEFLIQGSSRLIGKDQLRAIHECASNRHPLTLAAGERARLVVDAMSETEPLEHVHAALSHLPCRATAELYSHLDVLVGRQRVEQIVGLENETEISAHVHELLARQAGEIAIEDPDGALLHRAQGTDQADESRLAGTRRSGHDHELSRFNLQLLPNSTWFRDSPSP